nr:hypothetical protein [Tanacetum cinerariifolium]
GTLKFVSKTQDYQQYGALIPDDMINQDINYFEAYKTYYDFATRKVPPKKARKYKKVASPSRKLSPIKEAEPVKKGKELRDLPRSLLLCQQQVLSSEILLVYWNTLSRNMNPIATQQAALDNALVPPEKRLKIER